MTLVHEAIAGSRRLTPDVLWSIPRVGVPAEGPDGGVLVPVTTHAASAKKATTRLWLVEENGEARPLTSEADGASSPALSPDGSTLAFLRTRTGDEAAKPQVYLLPLGGGEATTPVELPLGVLDMRWLPDGTGLVLVACVLADHPAVEATRAELERRAEDLVNVRASDARLVRVWDTWLTSGEVPHFFHLDLASNECRDIVPDSTAWLDFMDTVGAWDLAPDGSELAFGGITLDAGTEEVRQRLYRVPLAGGPVECLTPDIAADAQRPRYTRDGTAIVYGRTEERYFYADRPRLLRFLRATGAHEPWCTEWDRAPQGWECAADGSLVFCAEEDARVHLYALAPGSSTPRRIREGGTVSAPCPCTDGRVLFQYQTLSRPVEIHAVGPGEAGERAVTSFTAEALSDVGRGAVHEIVVDGAEGEPVQSFVVLPPDHDDRAPTPFINNVHGGPHGISADSFHYRWNCHVFAAPGHVVAAPNFQGSTSWGNDYAIRIQGAWGDRPYRDVMAVTDALVGAGLADESRMAAIGGSYGGYMMAWIAGQTNRFRCLVNHAGVFNTLSMYASDFTQGRHAAYGGESWDGLSAIDAYNPARFTEGFSTPMLVIHGERDYRVPYQQGLECYGVLKAKGVPARLLVFPDENHWILKRHNSLRWYAEVLGWLERWLAGSG
jgi:dipeptidyl aminopeptidase/acylaminoacyl peptidase